MWTKKIITTTTLSLLAFICFSQSKDYKKGIDAFNKTDFKNAVKYLRTYADSGDSVSQFIVGYSYFNKNTALHNDSLAEYYLLKAAEQHYGRAMGLLSMLYLNKSTENIAYQTEALVWAEIAAAYDIIQARTSARFLLKNYMSEEELALAEKILIEKKKKFDKIDLTQFKESFPKKDNNNAKTKIPENTLGLMRDPYSNWISRWKYDNIECDTLYYTSNIEPAVIDSTIFIIKKQTAYKSNNLYRGALPKVLTLTNEEQELLVTALNNLKNHTWDADLFPFSKRLTSSEIAPTLERTEKLSKEIEKNMCSIIYTFSKPIFIRDNKMALFLDQKRYRGNYTQLSFNVYVLENGKWETYVTVYAHYEHR